ncbi:unnamed protein product [Rotaria socialis]|uniref:RapZ C-terminal domain-containing protein n=1 Tax=Rotaria socialis TaxID=392032 RepID=A0A817V711_9BILA|nr:unnamed protein product [Rotaria socialis]CAF4910556.1 unnamed protein product [Rotaria socialis]
MAQVEDINIKLFSFGHSFGVPIDVDLLFSIRHLPVTNVENYQQYDGRHQRIQNELLHLAEYEGFLETIIEQLKNFINEHNKNSITIAIGCEQGRHRSVALVERLGDLLGNTYNVNVNHRDLERTGYERRKQRERTKNRDRKYNNYADST